MALSDIDRRLLQRCLAGESQSWEEFVDRFMGLVLHVVNHTARARAIPLSPEDQEDIVAEIFLAILRKDFSVLRSFRGESSLATYLTVVARRISIRQLTHRLNATTLEHARQAAASGPDDEQRISDQEEVERLLAQLNGNEADVVRMYHLEGKSYQEISAHVGMPENTIGPTLSRARSKMRQASADSPLM